MFLAPIMPNPFQTATSITYSIPAGVSGTRLSIFDAGGRRVRTLTAAQPAAGIHTIVWDGTNDEGRALAGGVYYCRLTAEGRTINQPVVLLR